MASPEAPGTGKNEEGGNALFASAAAGSKEFVSQDFIEGPPWLRRLARWLDTSFAVTAGLVLMAMMLMTLFDVIGRYFINRPLGFAFEMTQVGMAMVVFLALPCVTLRSQHVTAGLFDGLFRGRAAHFRDAVFLGVAAASLGFVALRLLKLADRFHGYGERTSVLHLPVAWPAWVGVICLAVAAVIAACMTLAALWKGLSK